MQVADVEWRLLEERSERARRVAGQRQPAPAWGSFKRLANGNNQRRRTRTVEQLALATSYQSPTVADLRGRGRRRNDHDSVTASDEFVANSAYKLVDFAR